MGRTPFGARLLSLSRPRLERGFTLLELVVVMTVIAVLSVLALPSAEEASGRAQRQARDELLVLLEHARDSAHAQRREVCVSLTSTRATAEYAAGGACSGLALESPAGGPAAVDAPAGVTFTGPGQVLFDSRGRPVGAVDQTVAMGTLSLTVTRGTGRVR